MLVISSGPETNLENSEAPVDQIDFLLWLGVLTFRDVCGYCGALWEPADPVYDWPRCSKCGGC